MTIGDIVSEKGPAYPHLLQSTNSFALVTTTVLLLSSCSGGPSPDPQEVQDAGPSLDVALTDRQVGRPAPLGSDGMPSQVGAAAGPNLARDGDAGRRASTADGAVADAAFRDDLTRDSDRLSERIDQAGAGSDSGSNPADGGSIAGFRHPGLLNSRRELEFVRDRVQARQQPWASAYQRLSRRPEAQLDFAPRPFEEVSAAFDADLARGTEELVRSAHAAYAHALRWIVEQDPAHAKKAIAILNAWSSKLKEIHNGRVEGAGNHGLYSGWSGPVFVRAAEIIRYSYEGWASEDRRHFRTMLLSVFLPNVQSSVVCTAGNWELSYVEAVLAIAIYTDDRALFEAGKRRLDRYLPMYLYHRSDGSRPLLPCECGAPAHKQHGNPPGQPVCTDVGADQYWFRGAGIDWNEPFEYYPGHCQETCRDLNHTQMGIAAAINSLEMLLGQGIDLYARHRNRVVAALELHARLLVEHAAGKPSPEDLCGGTLRQLRVIPAWEIAYNHYAFRLGDLLPATQALIEQLRQSKVRPNKLHMAFDNLTHPQLPAMK